MDLISQCRAISFFLYPMKTSENLFFSDALGEYKKIAVP